MSDRPLLVTSDPDLLDELLRLCAAAGTEAEVAHDIAAARLSWSTPPLVVGMIRPTKTCVRIEKSTCVSGYSDR